MSAPMPVVAEVPADPAHGARAVPTSARRRRAPPPSRPRWPAPAAPGRGRCRPCRRRAAARRPAPGGSRGRPAPPRCGGPRRRRGGGRRRSCGATATTSPGSSAAVAHASSAAAGPPGQQRAEEPGDQVAQVACRRPRHQRVVDAEPGGRHGLEPGVADRLAADLAQAVGALVELGQGVLDLVELVLELVEQRLVLALLGGDLARVGEVLVVGRRTRRCRPPSAAICPVRRPRSSSSWPRSVERASGRASREGYRTGAAATGADAANAPRACRSPSTQVRTAFTAADQRPAGGRRGTPPTGVRSTPSCTPGWC